MKIDTVLEALKGDVAQWCNPLTPLTLQPELSGGMGSISDRTPPLERHDKGLRRSRPYGSR